VGARAGVGVGMHGNRRAGGVDGDSRVTNDSWEPFGHATPGSHLQGEVVLCQVGGSEWVWAAAGLQFPVTSWGTSDDSVVG
jgi:hypothetical protein